MTEPNEPQDVHRDPGLSGAYRAVADEAPPAALDAAILAAARAAVAAEPVRVLPWWRRLTVPAAVAASTLLAVMLSLTMERHPPMAPEVASPRAQPATATQSSVPVGDVADRSGLAKEAASPPARPSAPVAAPVLRAEPDEKKAKATAPVPLARDREPALVAPAMEGRLAAPAAKAESRNAADSAAPERARPALSPAPAMAPAGAVPLPEAAARRVAPRPEIVWLEEIRELRRQGKLEEAARRLAAFRTAYPDYPLPDDLK